MCWLLLVPLYTGTLRVENGQNALADMLVLARRIRSINSSHKTWSPNPMHIPGTWSPLNEKNGCAICFLYTYALIIASGSKTVVKISCTCLALQKKQVAHTSRMSGLNPKLRMPIVPKWPEMMQLIPSLEPKTCEDRRRETHFWKRWM